MSARSSERRVLDEASGLRAMTWVMGIMLFLTMLATALGLGTLAARTMLAGELAGRLTIQVIEGDAASREVTARKIAAAARALPEVVQAEVVDHAQLAQLLQPWLGSDAGDPDLPIPAMIDVGLTRGAGDGAITQVERAVARLAPGARVDRHASWMSPVTGFMTTLVWVAAGLVLLMVTATTAVVVLAARAGLEMHRGTIEVMHMLGSTDRQVARLFQRRIALDATLGALGGGAAALALTFFISSRLASLGSDLLGQTTLQSRDWAVLAGLPLAFILLATLAARFAVMATLRRTL